MRRFFLAALVFLAPSLVWAEGFYNPGVDCIPGVAGGGDLLVDAGATICVQRPTDDTAPANLSIRPASAWPFGTQDPADLILAGGMDEKSITVGDYTIAAADEVKITVNGVVVATLIEGVDFDCLTSNDVCAIALAVAIEAVSGASASAVAAKVGIEPDQCGTWGLSTAITDSIAADGAFATSDNGTDGAILAKADIDMGAFKLTFDDKLDYIDGGTNLLNFRVNTQLRLRLAPTLASIYTSLNIDDNNLLNVNDIYPPLAMASDAAPTPISFLGTKHPFPGIAAANNDGTDWHVIPSSSNNDLTGVTQANTAADTLSFTTIDHDGVSTTTVLTEGIDYQCVSAGSDADCVVNIAAAVNGLAAALGLNAVTVVGETTMFYPTVGTVAHLTVVSSDNTNTVIVRGTDGILHVHGDTTVSGVFRGESTALITGSMIAGSSVEAGDAASFRFDNRTEMWATADGKIYFSNDAADDLTQATFGPEAATHPALYPDGAAGVTLAGGAAVTDVMALDVTGNLTALKVNSDTHVFAGADYRVGFASRTLLESKETGDLLLMNYAMTGFDSLQLGPAMGTDAAPANTSILGANAWSQASAGDARIGGDRWECAGLGTMQIICDDYLDGAGDELIIAIVYGGGLTDIATLIEGIHWTAATGNEETCDSVGAAILIYYGAGGYVVADCDTTGGTCYLQPKHDLCDIQLSITNSAGDPFATLIEGADGAFVVGGDLTVTRALKTTTGSLELQPANGHDWGGQEKALPDNTATAFVNVGVVQSGHNHGTIWYAVWTVESGGGGDFATAQGMATFSAVNKAGTVTCDIQEGFATPAAGTESCADSSGGCGLTISFSCAESGTTPDTLDISITSDTDFGAITSQTVEWRMHTVEDYGITVL